MSHKIFANDLVAVYKIKVTFTLNRAIFEGCAY